MRIIVSASPPFPEELGGGQVYVEEIAQGLKGRGHEVILLTSAPWSEDLGGPAIVRSEHEGLPVVAISLPPEAISEGDRHSELGLALVRELRSIVEQIGPELVHINGLKAALIRICNQLGIPHVVTAHHPGFACPAGSSLYPDDSLCDEPARPKVCVPCCVRWRTSNPVLALLMSGVPRWLYRRIGKTLDRRRKIPYPLRGLRFPWLVEERLRGQAVRIRESLHIIAPSQAMRELLIRNGAQPEKISLIPHGITPLPHLSLEGLPDGPLRFGYIGRIDRDKGLHILLQALERVSAPQGCELHLIGEARNPWDQEYLQRCLGEYRGRAKILRHGQLPHRQLADAFRQIDVLVVPSIYLEAFGLVILEAFSAGRPVIVSDSGGPTELVRDGVDGLVVKRNRVPALAEAMQRFVDQPELVERMSRRIAPVRRQEEHVAQLEDLYGKLLSPPYRGVGWFSEVAAK